MFILVYLNLWKIPVGKKKHQKQQIWIEQNKNNLDVSGTRPFWGLFLRVGDVLYMDG